MATVAGSTSQPATVTWDTEPLKRSIKASTDAFVDAAQPHLGTLVKQVTVVASTSVATQGGVASKASVASQCPAILPLANIAIDSLTAPVVAFSTDSVSPLIDTGVQKIGEVAKDASHKSVDIGVDLSARSISFFGPTS